MTGEMTKHEDIGVTSEPSLLHAHFIKADKLMLVICYLLSVFSLALAPKYGTWGPALIIGLGTSVMLTLLFQMAAGSQLMRIMTAIGFMAMSALHIHQRQGMIEYHFGIFVLIAMLLFYRDWLVVLVAGATIAVHHVLFFILQSKGVDVYLLNSSDGSLSIVLLHAMYVVVETSLICWMAYDSKRDALATLELERSVNEITKNNNLLNLSYRINNDKLETNTIFDGFMATTDDFISSVKDLCSELNSSGQDLSAIVTDMKKSIDRQHNESDLVATAIEEISMSTQSVASSAQNASESSTVIGRDVHSGAENSQASLLAIESLASQINETSETVELLAKESSNIGSVLDVIQGIAEQTNLLALNAAIEAARAGEQGRGFAVVADEVRNLASKTQESTGQIQAIIQKLQALSKNSVESMLNSQTLVNNCVGYNRNVNEALHGISEKLDGVNQLNGEIAHTTGEQNNVVQEIAKNIVQIASFGDVSATDAELVEEKTQNFMLIVQSVQNSVDKFKTS